MPPRATLAQRLAWHQAHELHCACRPMPDQLRAMIDAATGNAVRRPNQAEKGDSARATRSRATHRYAAFLRGVSPMNLKMAALKQCLEREGFSDVKTLLSSGNVVFSTDPVPEQTLEARIEAALRRDVGRDFPVLVRSKEYLRRVIDSKPYASANLSNKHKRVITFLRVPPKGRVDLPVELDGATIVDLKQREVFSAYVPSPRGPVFMTLIERTFGKDVTTRTWDTLEKVMAALA